MKYFMCLFLTVFLHIAVSEAAIAASDTLLGSDIYYPLTPRTMTFECHQKGTVGSNIRQIAILKPRIMNGVKVTPSVISGDNIKHTITRFLQRTQDGLFIVAIQTGDGIISRFNVKIPILNAQIRKGTSFDSDVTLTSADGKSTLKSHYTYSIEDTNEVVKTPYGQFSNCLKIKCITQTGDKVNEVTYWLAPQVGAVKNIEVSKSSHANDITETEVLLKKIDYSIPAQTAQNPVVQKKTAPQTQARPAGNYIANMKSVDFLLFYIAVIAAGSILGWMFIQKADSAGSEMVMVLPPNPDPYEISYLRGGIQEVMRLAVFKLVQARSLVSSGKDRKIARVDGSIELSAMSDKERAVYDELIDPQTMRSISKRLSSKFRGLCYPLEQRLVNERLLTTQAAKGRARLVRVALLSIVFFLGGYRLYIALSSGRTNVGFLIFLAVIATILILRIFRTPRLSKRGRDYLKALQEKFKDSKNSVVPDQGIENTGLSLLVALFGITVLQGTPYAPYLTVLALPDSSSFYSDVGVGGGGCGGGGGGCGGGN